MTLQALHYGRRERNAAPAGLRLRLPFFEAACFAATERTLHKERTGVEFEV
jgi:hypothetical protein